MTILTIIAVVAFVAVVAVVAVVAMLQMLRLHCAVRHKQLKATCNCTTANRKAAVVAAMLQMQMQMQQPHSAERHALQTTTRGGNGEVHKVSRPCCRRYLAVRLRKKPFKFGLHANHRVWAKTVKLGPLNSGSPATRVTPKQDIMCNPLYDLYPVDRLWYMGGSIDERLAKVSSENDSLLNDLEFMQ